MGMFDTVRSSYPLIDDEADLELQTKDLDCLLHHYWISPAGQLYRVDMCPAYNQEEISEKLGRKPWQWIQWVRNGKNGMVTPDFRTALVELYPGRMGKGNEWPWVRAFFKHGVIQETFR
jgi:hypothetical protein